MKEMFKDVGRIIAATFSDFLEDDCMSMAAALAFYTMFSLPPLLLIVVSLVSSLFPFPQERVTSEVTRQLSSFIGEGTGKQIVEMLQNIQPSGSTTVATILGILVLLFAATSVLAQLQYSLNIAWQVEPDPEQGGLRNFMIKRVLSLAMLVAIAFLLLVSMVISTGLEAVHHAVQELLVNPLNTYLMRVANIFLSFLVITFLFAAIYKVLPDAKITWRDVSVGAIVSALLFVIGKFGISVYLGQSNVGSAYGAASALAILLIWVYYASLIVFFGAEFTQVWARRHGKGLRPIRGAIRAVRRRELVHPGEILPPESKERKEGKIIEDG